MKMSLQLPDVDWRVDFDVPDDLYRALAHPPIPASLDDEIGVKRFTDAHDLHVSAMSEVLKLLEPAVLALGPKEWEL